MILVAARMKTQIYYSLSIVSLFSFKNLIHEQTMISRYYIMMAFTDLFKLIE